MILVTIAKSRRALGRLAKRTVEPGRVLGGVGDDDDLLESALIEPVPDGAHPPVHHVRGGDHLGTGRRVGQRLAEALIAQQVADLLVLLFGCPDEELFGEPPRNAITFWGHAAMYIDLDGYGIITEIGTNDYILCVD